MKNLNKYFDATGGTTQVACHRLFPLVPGLGGLPDGVDGSIIAGALLHLASIKICSSCPTGSVQTRMPTLFYHPTFNAMEHP
jgi:hypothetical protein